MMILQTALLLVMIVVMALVLIGLASLFGHENFDNPVSTEMLLREMLEENRSVTNENIFRRLILRTVRTNRPQR